MSDQQPPPATPITHTLHEPWSSHVRACLQEIESCRADELRLRGLILEAQERANRRRANLQELVTLIVRDAGLPSDISYSISSNGSTITST